MRRREFICLIGGSAAATWPLAARAQQRDRMRRIGALMSWSETDPRWQSYFAEFVQELARLGWVDQRNARIDQRWSDENLDRTLAFARELIELQPDAILAGGALSTSALQRETRNIPIVFAVVSDPVGLGFVAGLSRPGGNITGFSNIEGAIAGKWLEMIKQVAPRLKRAALMFNPDTTPNAKFFLGPFEAAAQALAVDPIVAPVHNDPDIEAIIESMGRAQGGLVMMSETFVVVHRATIIAAAARYKVPTVFPALFYAREGGLLSYGPSVSVMFRGAASYVDRILRGEKPAELPVQVPTKWETAINLKTAKTLGLDVPAQLLAGADEVIE